MTNLFSRFDGRADLSPGGCRPLSSLLFRDSRLAGAYVPSKPAREVFLVICREKLLYEESVVQALLEMMSYHCEGSGTDQCKDLTADERFVVAWYTSDVQDLGLSVERNWWFVVNALLRMRGLDGLLAHQEALFYLQSAVQKLSNPENSPFSADSQPCGLKLFPGIRLGDPQLAGYSSVGSRVCWPSYTSGCMLSEGEFRTLASIVDPTQLGRGGTVLQIKFQPRQQRTQVAILGPLSMSAMKECLFGVNTMIQIEAIVPSRERASSATPVDNALQETNGLDLIIASVIDTPTFGTISVQAQKAGVPTATPLVGGTQTAQQVLPAAPLAPPWEQPTPPEPVRAKYPSRADFSSGFVSRAQGQALTPPIPANPTAFSKTQLRAATEFTQGHEEEEEEERTAQPFPSFGGAFRGGFFGSRGRGSMAANPIPAESHQAGSYDSPQNAFMGVFGRGRGGAAPFPFQSRPHWFPASYNGSAKPYFSADGHRGTGVGCRYYQSLGRPKQPAAVDSSSSSDSECGSEGFDTLQELSAEQPTDQEKVTAPGKESDSRTTTTEGSQSMQVVRPTCGRCATCKKSLYADEPRPSAIILVDGKEAALCTECAAVLSGDTNKAHEYDSSLEHHKALIRLVKLLLSNTPATSSAASTSNFYAGQMRKVCGILGPLTQEQLGALRIEAVASATNTQPSSSTNNDIQLQWIAWNTAEGSKDASNTFLSGSGKGGAPLDPQRPTTLLELAQTASTHLFPRLELILCKGSDMRDDVATAFGKCSQLKAVVLPESAVTDAGMNALVSGCPELHLLYLPSCYNLAFSFAAPAAAPGAATTAPAAMQLKRLRSINVSSNHNLRGRQLQFLVESANSLQDLNVSGCGAVTKEVIKSIAECASLKGLNLSNLAFQVNDQDIQTIANGACAAVLESLNLHGCKYSVGDRSVKQLGAKCPNLRHIDLSTCANITGVGLTALAKGCPNLVAVSLADCRITDFGLRALGIHCRSLQKLDVSGSSLLTARGIEWLKDCSELYYLDISFCNRMADSALIAIGQNFPCLQHLDLTGCDFLSDQGLIEGIAKCANLTHLSLSLCPNVTDLGLKAGLLRSQATIQQLEVARCKKVTLKCLKELPTQCPALSRLDVAAGSLSQAQIQALAQICAANNCEVLTLEETAPVKKASPPFFGFGPF
jgi:EIN3-binding F-box protein